MRLFALLVFVVACGGSDKPQPVTPEPAIAPDPIPATAGPECGVVADKLAIVMNTDKPEAQAGARAELKARCASDKWSDEARNCFATVDTDEEVDGCKQHLSDSQRAAFGDPWGAGPAAPAAASAAPAPAPAPKKKNTTRGPVRRDAADPQEGGEAKADPQEGGE